MDGNGTANGHQDPNPLLDIPVPFTMREGEEIKLAVRKGEAIKKMGKRSFRRTASDGRLRRASRVLRERIDDLMYGSQVTMVIREGEGVVSGITYDTLYEATVATIMECLASRDENGNPTHVAYMAAKDLQDRLFGKARQTIQVSATTDTNVRETMAKVASGILSNQVRDVFSRKIEPDPEKAERLARLFSSEGKNAEDGESNG